MSERVIETQVIEIKVKGATEITALERAAQKAQAMLDEARKRLDALARAQKIGPPTQIEATRTAVKELGAAAKSTQAAVTAATKAQKAEAGAAVKAAREATAAEKARTREAVAGARERARAVVQAEKAASAASKEASERSRAAMENAVDAAKKYERALAAARAQAEALSNTGGGMRSRFAGVGAKAGGLLAGGARAVGVGALAAVTGAAAIGGGALSQIVSRGSDFAANRAALVNNLGGKQEADDQIAGLRSVRGLNVGDGIATSNRLAGLGLDSSVGSVKNLASIAAGSPGKTTGDVAEALADAGTGETERLKEFGIKAKSVGDQFEVTFKGITTTIEKGSASWQAYLGKIAESDFGNTLELKANSLGGGIESLQDKITAAASAIYDSGLGEAIQAVVADIGEYFNISGKGAKGLGEVLGNAVKSLWTKIKELIGPVGELPGKFEKVINVATTFAEIFLKVVGVLGDVVGVLGTTGTAFTAMGLAGLAAFGPLGLAAAGIVTAIMLISDALEDTTKKARELENQTRRIAQTEIVRKQLSGDYGEDPENVARLRAGLEARKAAAKETRSTSGYIMSPKEIIADREKRALDALELEKEEADVKAAEDKIARKQRDAKRLADDEADKAAAAERKTADDASELISDTVEFESLSRKKSKTPSQKKRLAELSKKLDKSVPGKGKTEKSAYQGEVEAEIKSRSQDAGRVAGLRANRNGATKTESDAIALRTEKETTARLKSQVDRGQLLPGQIQANVLALARVEDVASRGTPPPIAVTNIGPVTVTVPVDVSGNTINADARQIGVEVRRVVKTVMVEETRDAIRRVTSGVRG